MTVNKPEDTYERYKLCPDLIPGHKCFRVQHYNKGNFDEVFHEHVPFHRISLDSELEILRVLAGHYADWSGTFILHSRLNKRRGGPHSILSLLTMSYIQKRELFAAMSVRVMFPLGLTVSSFPVSFAKILPSKRRVQRLEGIVLYESPAAMPSNAIKAGVFGEDCLSEASSAAARLDE